jgi:hypothetical protein
MIPLLLPSPCSQSRHRDQLVVVAALDRPGRLLLIRAQDAIGAVLDCDAGDLAALGYAALVTAAQAAYRDWQDALRIAKLNDKYLDLVARTAADELAVTEIGDLAEHAGKAAQAFRDTAREVSAAGAALVLPAG